MTLDPIMEKEFEKFKIDEEIKGKGCKYLTKDEKFQIVLNFFKEKNIKYKNMISNSMEKIITYTFETKTEAEKFADSPSIGLLAFGRKYVAEKGKDPKDYDIAFNLSILHDKKGNTPNVVVIKLLWEK